MIPRRVVRDLERQLAREPGNLTVRVTLAAAYREAGRGLDAVEQYRVVAIACLEQGRLDEARSAIGSGQAIAPDDGGLRALEARWRGLSGAVAGPGAMRTLTGVHAPRGSRGPELGPAPAMSRPSARAPSSSAHDLETPLPAPMPLHEVAGDSLIGMPAGLRPELDLPTMDEAIDDEPVEIGLPVVALTEVRRVGLELPASADFAAELATRKRPRVSAHDLELLDLDVLGLVPLGRGAGEGEVTSRRVAAIPPVDGPGGEIDPGQITMDIGPEDAIDDDDAVSAAQAAIDTAIDTAPLAERDPPPARAAPVAARRVTARRLPAVTPIDFADEDPTEPPAPGASAPGEGHAALLVPPDDDPAADAAAAAAADAAVAAAARARSPRVATADHGGGDGGTFAGGFTGTLAALSPDGAAVDGPLGVFSMLPDEAALELARRAVVKLYDPGEVVVREGDAGDACYVVARGEVVVTRRGAGDRPEELARLGHGALFGEFALLADRRRHATVTALGEAEIYVVPRILLRELAAIFPDVGPALERFYRERLLANLIHASPLFQPLAVRDRARLLAAFEPVRVESGHAIVRQGEPAGGLYLIVLGAVEVVCRTDDRRAVVLATLSEGAYVGEISLLTDDVATASVIACGPVELAALPSPAFYRLVSEYPALWAALRDEADARRLRTARLLSGRTGVV